MTIKLAQFLDRYYWGIHPSSVIIQFIHLEYKGNLADALVIDQEMYRSLVVAPIWKDAWELMAFMESSPQISFCTYLIDRAVYKPILVRDLPPGNIKTEVSVTFSGDFMKLKRDLAFRFDRDDLFSTTSELCLEMDDTTPFAGLRVKADKELEDYNFRENITPHLNPVQMFDYLLTRASNGKI